MIVLERWNFGQKVKRCRHRVSTADKPRYAAFLRQQNAPKLSGLKVSRKALLIHRLFRFEPAQEGSIILAIDKNQTLYVFGFIQETASRESVEPAWKDPFRQLRNTGCQEFSYLRVVQ